jgi:hypothetical protein
MIEFVAGVCINSSLKLKGAVMFKKLIFLICVISLCAHASSGWGENFNFRYCKWGMAAEDVIASEKKLEPVESNPNIIRYKTEILGRHVELAYLFSQNKLIGSFYKLDDNYLNSNHFLTTYNKFKAALTEKYGFFADETTHWTNDTFRNVSQKKGLALSLGQVEYFSDWDTPSTRINLSLKEENYYVLCVIEYWSKEFAYLSEEAKKEDAIDPF